MARLNLKVEISHRHHPHPDMCMPMTRILMRGKVARRGVLLRTAGSRVMPWDADWRAGRGRRIVIVTPLQVSLW